MIKMHAVRHTERIEALLQGLMGEEALIKMSTAVKIDHLI